MITPAVAAAATTAATVTGVLDYFTGPVTLALPLATKAVAGTVGQLLDQAARRCLAESIGANQPSAEESIIFMGNLKLTPSVAGGRAPPYRRGLAVRPPPAKRRWGPGLMPAEEGSEIHCRLDELLAARGRTLTELSKRVGVSLVNLSALKNDRAKAIRFSTLTAICQALDCQVGELLVVRR